MSADRDRVHAAGPARGEGVRRPAGVVQAPLGRRGAGARPAAAAAAAVEAQTVRERANGSE